MAHFQVKLGGQWKNYSNTEDKILKRAFMAGFPNVRFSLRGQNYSYDFKRMVQMNGTSQKERQIRAPHGWSAPTKPVCQAGATTVVSVPHGAAGSTIRVPNPRFKGETINVHVPRTAKPGQAMLVPVPEAASKSAGYASGDTTSAKDASAGAKGTSAWATGGKVAVGATALGVAYVGGIVLGDHIYDHGLDATVEAAGEGLEDAGEAVAEFAVDAGEFAVDAAEDVGDFIMDLF